MTLTASSTTQEPVLEIDGISTEFRVSSARMFAPRDRLVAVSDVSLRLFAGETLGIVGESGCGKSTLVRSIIGLEQPQKGTVRLSGRNLQTLKGRALRTARRDIQMIFQDPYDSLNPRMTLEQVITEPWSVHKEVQPNEGRRERVVELLEQVGLHADDIDRYPSELSGGQRQRVSIARALALSPKVLLCDEPLSALDVSIQAQIVELLNRLQSELGLALILISHDIAIVEQICDRVAVMYLGSVVESGPTTTVTSEPNHPYTKALLSSTPRVDFSRDSGAEEIVLEGDLPDPKNPPSGCKFRTRCWKAQQLCADVDPPISEAAGDRIYACHFPLYKD